MPTPRDNKRFTDEQIANARTIISVGRSLGASSRDLLISLMTAWQESGLKNLDYGDRDSVGLFQQRNAWGSFADRTNPTKSARMFFLGGQQGQRGLFDFKNRNGMSLTEAAQSVQVSAYPDAYAKHEGRSRALLELLGDTAPATDPGVTQPTEQNPISKFLDDMTALEQDPMMGIGAAQLDTKGMPVGVSAATMPGIESGDKMPTFEFGAGAPAPDPLAGLGDGDGGMSFDNASSLFSKVTGESGSAKRDLVIRTAKQMLGLPYVWGGTDASSGVDCSGLTQLALKAAGVSLPRVSYQQANAGRRVGFDQLQPGDLVAWDNSSRNNGADHIALWLGNGLILEAPRSGLSVRIRQLDDDEGAWGVKLDY